jgi:hypothetical protein
MLEELKSRRGEADGRFMGIAYGESVYWRYGSIDTMSYPKLEVSMKWLGLLGCSRRVASIEMIDSGRDLILKKRGGCVFKTRVVQMKNK